MADLGMYIAYTKTGKVFLSKRKLESITVPRDTGGMLGTGGNPLVADRTAE